MKKSIKYFGIAAAAAVLEFFVFLVWGLLLPGGDEMGFSLITLYIVLPVTALIFSAVLANKSPFSLIPFVPIILLAHIFLPFFIFGTFEILLSLALILIPCLVGAAIGAFMKYYKNGGR